MSGGGNGANGSRGGAGPGSGDRDRGADLALRVERRGRGGAGRAVLHRQARPERRWPSSRSTGTSTSSPSAPSASGSSSPTSATRIELGGVKIGQTDQEFFLSRGPDWPLAVRVRVGPDPARRSRPRARLLATEPSDGVFTLPTPRPLARRLQRGARRSTRSATRWDTARFGFTLTPTPGLGSPARVHLDPQGRRPPDRHGVRQPGRQLLRGPAADRPGRPRLPDPRDVVGRAGGSSRPGTRCRCSTTA